MKVCQGLRCTLRVHVFHSGAPAQKVETSQSVCTVVAISSLVMQGNSSPSSSEVSHVGIQMSQMNGRTRFGRQRSNRGFGHDVRVRRRSLGVHTAMDGERLQHRGSKQGSRNTNIRLMKLPVHQTDGSSWL